MTSKAYCYVADGGGEPRICGQYAVVDNVGYFSYGKSWLARPDAFPLDPINLPLTESEFVSTMPHGVFGVLSDAGPDTWGRKLQLATHRQSPTNEAEWLLVGSGHGAGCLLFSGSRSAVRLGQPAPDFADFALFIELSNAVESGKTIDLTMHPEWARVMEYGSSMGGAKPKALVTLEGEEWIAKLNRPQLDTVDVVRIEGATLELARLAGIHTVDTRLTTVGGRSVLLIKRFDRDIAGRRHYISVHSLLNAGRISESDATTTYTYGHVCDLARRLGTDMAQTGQEFFRRMVFNVLVGNTDDHARNHGFLKNIDDHGYQLTPAFDISPQQTYSGLHGLGLGNEGSRASRDNVLSQHKRFLLTRAEAEEEWDRQVTIIQGWKDVFSRHDISEHDMVIAGRAILQA